MQKLLFTVPVLRTLRRMALCTVLLLAGSVLAQDPAQKLRIACAGDSITAGIGAANMKADSYPAQLQRLLGDAYEVLNFGAGGRTLSRQADPYAFSPALQAQPDIVICTLGTNDCKPYCWPKHKNAFVKDYTELLLLFRKRNPAVKLFVGLPPPAYEDRWGISERVLAEEVRPAVRAVAEFRYTFRKSSLTQQMIVYPGRTRIDFKTRVEWNERETLMKVAFPTTLRSTRARFDIQYGSVERPTTKNTSWEAAKFETVGHKWADLSESGYGAALMNDSKYGYDVHDGVLRLTLLKSSNSPDYTADAGLQAFAYSIFLHRGEWYEAGVDRESWELNDAPLVFSGRTSLPALFPASLPGVTFDAVKPAEDGNALILRLHEKEGRHASVSIPTAFPFQSWCACNLLERRDGEPHKEKKLRLTLRPFEIKTIKFSL